MELMKFEGTDFELLLEVINSLNLDAPQRLTTSNVTLGDVTLLPENDAEGYNAYVTLNAIEGTKVTGSVTVKYTRMQIFDYIVTGGLPMNCNCAPGTAFTYECYPGTNLKLPTPLTFVAPEIVNETQDPGIETPMPQNNQSLIWFDAHESWPGVYLKNTDVNSPIPV